MSLQLLKAGLALGLFGRMHKFLDDKVVNAMLWNTFCITMILRDCSFFLHILMGRSGLAVTCLTVV